MIQSYLFSGLFLLFALSAFAQFPVGHKSLIFSDPARNNRPIPTEIYYPATSAGDDKPVAAGQFPVIAFGHGFVMAWSAYENIWQALVPEGYIICMPKTEDGFAPSHEDFGKDLAFLIGVMQQQNSASGGSFEDHIRPKFAVMGHSMGGGSALLAPQFNAAITTVVALAPAETNPSAIAACAGIQQRTLIITGSKDCIAPGAQNGEPMFAMLAAACKVYVSILGANHCQFADYNLYCTIGESTAGCPAVLSRDEQHAALFSLLKPWLGFHLRGQANDLAVFNNTLSDAALFEAQQSCPDSVVAAPSVTAEPGFSLYPSPAGDVLFVKVLSTMIPRFFAVNALGQQSELMPLEGNGQDIQLNIKGLDSGMYWLKAVVSDSQSSRIFYKK